MSVCDVYMNSKIPRPEGKRETGGSPVRTRHCKRGAKAKIVTGKPGRRLIALISKSGDLPFAGTGTRSRVSSHEILAVRCKKAS